MKQDAKSTEFEIKQKNSFDITKFEIYQNGRQVGNINLRHLELYGKSYKFSRKWNLSRMYACRSDNTNFGYYQWSWVNMIFYFPVLACDKIVIGNKEYKVCPRKKFSYNADIFENKSNKVVIKYARKKFFTKNDIIQFSPRIKKEDYPAFIGLLFFR